MVEDRQPQGQLITQPSGTRPASALLSPGLKKLLTEGDDAGGACRLIGLNATLRAECERVLPELEAAKVRAEPEAILELVARRMVAYGITANMAYSHGVTWESYVTALEGFPLYAIEAAFDRWDRGEGTKGDVAAAGYPPRPPQLAILAAPGKTELWTAAYRARKALEHVERSGADWTPERKRAERQKMIDLGFLNPDGTPNLQLRPKTVPLAQRPRQSPQEVAERLRSMSGHDDIGDVV